MTANRKLYVVSTDNNVTFIPYVVRSREAQRRLLERYPKAHRITQATFRAFGGTTTRNGLDSIELATLDELDEA